MNFVARNNWLKGAAAGAMLVAAAAVPAKAEVGTVNLAQQFGLLYVPLHVVLEHNLVDKHAKAIGVAPPEIKLFKISGGANINKALLAKSCPPTGVATTRHASSPRSWAQWPPRCMCMPLGRHPSPTARVATATLAQPAAGTGNVRMRSSSGPTTMSAR